MCIRHPTGASHGGHCAACLLEDALAEAPPPERQWDQLVIRLPLGATASSSVFLATPSGPPLRLLRLKTWHTAAPRDFMTRFHFLQGQFARWTHPAVPLPLAAWVDACGRPFELSEFHQGIPILERAESGGFNRVDADDSLATLRTILCSAHRAGLVHGSVLPANILVSQRGNQVHLLDFGHAALMASDGDRWADAAADIANLDHLAEAVRVMIAAHPRPAVTTGGFS